MSLVPRCGFCGKLEGPQSFGSSLVCDCTLDGRCGPHGNRGPCSTCLDERLEDQRKREAERARIRADLQSQEIY